MNIYLDIDGVLVTKDKRPANGVTEFLSFITDRFDCYWLTTHCRDGNPAQAIDYVQEIIKIDKGILEKINSSKPWYTYKTHAIDFNRDFRWLDDFLLVGEIKTLNRYDALDKVIRVSLQNDPDGLLFIKDMLKELS
jgi:hypothetical protein